MGYGEIFTKEIMLQLKLKEKENLFVRQMDNTSFRMKSL